MIGGHTWHEFEFWIIPFSLSPPSTNTFEHFSLHAGLWHDIQNKGIEWKLLLPIFIPKQEHYNTPSKDVKSGLFLLCYSNIPFLKWSPSLPSSWCFCSPRRRTLTHISSKDDRRRKTSRDPEKKILCKMTSLFFSSLLLLKPRVFSLFSVSLF